MKLSKYVFFCVGLLLLNFMFVRSMLCVTVTHCHCINNINLFILISMGIWIVYGLGLFKECCNKHMLLIIGHVNMFSSILGLLRVFFKKIINDWWILSSAFSAFLEMTVVFLLLWNTSILTIWHKSNLVMMFYSFYTLLNSFC